MAMAEADLALCLLYVTLLHPELDCVVFLSVFNTKIHGWKCLNFYSWWRATDATCSIGLPSVVSPHRSLLNCLRFPSLRLLQFPPAVPSVFATLGHTEVILLFSRLAGAWQAVQGYIMLHLPQHPHVAISSLGSCCSLVSPWEMAPDFYFSFHFHKHFHLFPLGLALESWGWDPITGTWQHPHFHHLAASFLWPRNSIYF